MHHSYIDRFAQGDSVVHRLDARAKLLVLIAYTVVLITFDRYAVGAMVPMVVGPLVMLRISRVPLWFALRRVLVLSPFVLTLCFFSVFYDPSARFVAFGPWGFWVSGGWITASNVGIKFVLSLFAMTAVTSATPFALLLEAMRKLGLPKLLVQQLGLLYRYIFVLIDEGMRMRRARDFRGASQAPLSRRLTAVGGIVGQLFVRTLDRSERVYTAMRARGYRGESHSLTHLKLRLTDTVFLTVSAGYLVFCRWIYPVLIHRS